MDESGRFPLNVYNTESVKLQLSYKEFTGLAEIDHTGKVTRKKGGFTCSNINFDECVNMKKANLMLDKTTDNCTVPFIFQNEKICTQPNDIRIAYKISRRKFEGQRTTNIDCDVPCKTLFTSFGGKAESVPTPPSDQQIEKGNGNVQQEQDNLKLYFSPRVQKIQEHELYGFINLIAESGNYNLLKYV